MPPHSATRLFRAAKRRFRLLRKSARNAIDSFHPHEGHYHLTIERIGSFEIAYRFGTVDRQVIEDSFADRARYSEIADYEPSPTDCIIDVGAHIGTFALLAASHSPQGRVYALEPSLESYDYLRVNKALNAAHNIEVRRVALSDTAGSTVLHHDDGSWGHSITKQLSSRGEVVPTQTLAGFMVEEGIDRCDLVKFNCEGAEFPILMSSSPAALQPIRTMIVLYHGDLVDRWGVDDLREHLRKAGFRVEAVGRQGVRGTLVATRI